MGHLKASLSDRAKWKADEINANNWIQTRTWWAWTAVVIIVCLDAFGSWRKSLLYRFRNVIKVGHRARSGREPVLLQRFNVQIMILVRLQSTTHLRLLNKPSWISHAHPDHRCVSARGRCCQQISHREHKLCMKILRESGWLKMLLGGGEQL